MKFKKIVDFNATAVVIYPWLIDIQPLLQQVPNQGKGYVIMASLRKMVGSYRDELRDGIAHVAFWKEGRSWNAEAFWLDPVTGSFEADDLDRIEEILETDSLAIIVNGYTDCPFTNCDEDGKVSDIDFMMSHIRWRYEEHSCMLVSFYKGDVTESEEQEPVQEEPMFESKQLICEMLVPVLRMTRNLYDLKGLTYDPKTELVTATFASGYTKKANVAMDSGTSMIRDIIGQIV